MTVLWTVIKKNTTGEETWRYTGQELRRSENQITIEAFFNRADLEFHEIWMRQGDRFVETFYSDRWYNVFAIHDKDNNRLKGWYCNVCCPAEFDGGKIAYVDLALDLLVYPDGRQLVLDQDEFEELPISADLRLAALAGMSALQQHMSAEWHLFTG